MGDHTRNSDSTSNISWNTEDELEIDSALPSCTNLEIGETSRTEDCGSSSSNASSLFHLVKMGFGDEEATNAIDICGNDTPMDELIHFIMAARLCNDVDAPLQEQAQEGHPSSSVRRESVDSRDEEYMPLDSLVEMGFGADETSAAIDRCGQETSFGELIEFIEAARFRHVEDAPQHEQDLITHRNHLLKRQESVDSSDEEYLPLAFLLEVGYEADEALAAIDRCGQEASFEELIEFIEAARLRHDEDAPQQERAPIACRNNLLKRKQTCSTSGSRMMKKPQTHTELRYQTTEEEEKICLPNPMIGFGVPCHPLLRFSRNLSDVATGPPYFYYENVAITPKGTWPTIRRFLYDIEPEFVDSKCFSAAYRKRGYIHNLPTSNRFQLQPIPPSTIQEALPNSIDWWRSWDTRKKLNCLVTCIGSAQLTERIRIKLEKYSENGEEPPLHVCDDILKECKKWNLVWVGKNKVAPLEPHEMEVLMGFPQNHTRGFSKTDRHKFLGNSFQVDTVAYHLSVLKNMYPGGINVLSLFSGIGGAEVALHRLGIPLKNVVSIENNKKCRNIVKDWWEQTKQRGKLIHIDDVQKVEPVMLEQWVSEFGGFDLVIGGSPCNNLAGGNRWTRDGLEGEHSSLFYEYYRILDAVRYIMRQQ